MKNPKREMFAELMRDLKNDSSVSTEIKNSINLIGNKVNYIKS